VGSPSFVEHAGWVSATVTVANPASDRWAPEARVTFIAMDAERDVAATYETALQLPPSTSVLAIAPSFPLPPGASPVARMRVRVHVSRWKGVADYRPSPVSVAGISLRHTSPDGVAVNATVVNRGHGPTITWVRCAALDGRGGLVGTGAAALQVAPESSAALDVPIEHAGPGSLRADCRTSSSGP
jgi:hypothetical protein